MRLIETKIIEIFNTILNYIIIVSNNIGYFINEIRNSIIYKFPAFNIIDNYFIDLINRINEVYDIYIKYSNIKIFIIIGLLLYIYERRRNNKKCIYAFIPILNLVLLLDIVNINLFFIILLINPITRGILVLVFIYRYLKIINKQYSILIFLLTLIRPEIFIFVFIIYNLIETRKE